MVTVATRLEVLASSKEGYEKPSVLKSKDATLLTKVCIVKAMVFPVVMYRCDSWTIKLSTKELMLLNFGVGKDS